MDFRSIATRLAATCLSALILGACASEQHGVRRLPQPQLADVAMARRAAYDGNWQLAASAWYEIYLRNDENATTACIEAARALLELGDAASARQLLDHGLRQFPEHPDLLEMQGDALVSSGFRRAAEPYYERALERGPERVSTLLALARLRVDLGLEAAALPLLDKRIALGAGDAETWLLIARARRAAGDFIPALTAYRTAFDLGESRPDRLVYAASLYLQLGGPERALFDVATIDGWLRRACELDPQSTSAHEALGELFELRHDLEHAQECYSRAVESDPARASSRQHLGRLLRKRGDLAGAAELAQQALEFDKDPERRAEWERWIEEAKRAQAPEPDGD